MTEVAERARAMLQRFSGAPERLWMAPGRVNLIGDHVDYHEGLVCPIAINRHTAVAMRARSDRIVRMVSAEREGLGTFALDEPSRASHAWFDYVEGVARALEASGARLRGADVAVASDVPIGAGLSSSAALEVAAGAGLLDNAGNAVDLSLVAAAGRRAENDFVGVASGIMDQLAVAFGMRGHALEIDCRSKEIAPIPIPAEAVFVVADSGERHALVSSGYNERRAESERAATLLGRPLRDADSALVERADLPDVVRRRARHVVTEIARVRSFVRSLRDGDLAAAGQDMIASHASLRDDYAVSTPELDALVARALELPGVYGARMTGGGFGGSIIAMARSNDAEHIARSLAWRAAATMIVVPSDGVSHGSV